MAKFRRVVTGHDGQGNSVVLFDGEPAARAATMTDMWATDRTPASNQGGEDDADRPLRLPPPDGGSAFRFVRIAPESSFAGMAPEERAKAARERFVAMGAEDALVADGPHPAMHRTRTVDYIIVLEGKITMILDQEEVELEPFDVVIQRGTSHAWANFGEEPALFAAVLIDAEPL